MILVMAYGKNEQDDLDAGDKTAIADLLDQCEQALAEKYSTDNGAGQHAEE